MTPIFITGGTGYIGKRLIRQLVAKGYDVTALVRKGSEQKLPPGVRAIIGDPFDAATFQNWIPKGAVFIHLLGTSHSSAKKNDFYRSVDLPSVKASAAAATKASVSHFIYVSIAMADVNLIKEFRETRKEAEAHLLSKNLICTFIRPWYVTGPSRRWPIILSSLYKAAHTFSPQKEKSKPLSLVSIGQIIATMEKAVDSPPSKLRVFEISHMKRNSLPAI